MKIVPYPMPGIGEASDVPGSDARWKILMIRANEAFCANDLGEALSFYLECFDEAERLLQLALAGIARPDSGPATALTVSASNAACVYTKQGRLEEAGNILLRTLSSLREAISDGTAAPELRMTCVEHVDGILAHLGRYMHLSSVEKESIAFEIAETREVAGLCLASLRTRYFH